MCALEAGLHCRSGAAPRGSQVGLLKAPGLRAAEPRCTLNLNPMKARAPRAAAGGCPRPPGGRARPRTRRTRPRPPRMRPRFPRARGPRTPCTAAGPPAPARGRAGLIAPMVCRHRAYTQHPKPCESACPPCAAGVNLAVEWRIQSACSMECWSAAGPPHAARQGQSRLSAAVPAAQHYRACATGAALPR